MIKFQNVSKQYGKETLVLDDVSFVIDPGNFVFLVGPTGAGKTTIFRMLIKDLEPSSGDIYLGDWHLAKLSGSKIPHLRRKVGTIFQDLKLLMDRTVIENVMLPLMVAGVGEKEAKGKAEEALFNVGLGGKEIKFPLQLSGGERQRVAIARALIFEPEVLLADEPTGNLDLQTSLQILDLLDSINKKGTTILMATHNDTIIEKTDKRILMMEKGKLVKDKDAKKKEKEAETPKKEEQPDEKEMKGEKKHETS